MTNDTLNNEEKEIILAALSVVAPTGGGSAEYSLKRKLASEWFGDEFFDNIAIDKKAERYWNTVDMELKEMDAE